MSIEKFNIEQAVQGLPRAMLAAVSVRAALRVIPMLASVNEEGESGLICWKAEERAQHLLALFGICNTRVSWVLFNDYDFMAEIHSSGKRHTYAWEAAQTIMEYHYFDRYAFAAANAAVAPGTATDAAICIAPPGPGGPYETLAEVIVRAARINPLVEDEIAHDLKNIGMLDAVTLFQQPLWRITATEIWEPQFQLFKTAALQLNAGFEYWLDWLGARHTGQPLDVELHNQSVNATASVSVEDVVAYNTHLNLMRKVTLPEELTNTYH